MTEGIQPDPDDEGRDIPLHIKFETKPLWADVRAVLGLDATGAAIVMALYEAYAVGTPVSYSRASDFYRPSRYKNPLFTLGKVLRAVDMLDDAGLIDHFRQVPGARGWQSSMAATPNLIGIVDQILAGKPRLKLVKPIETILLRDKDGRLVDYRDNRNLDRMRKKIASFNEAVSGAEIMGGDGVNLSCYMARIFNIDWKRGGRFYGMGTSWQNIKAEARQHIMIDGEPVVELDFKTLHPAIL